MDITIYRGTHCIGGCVTEYKTETTRILVDFGPELGEITLPGLELEGVTKGNVNCDGVLFTHYHGDHTGMLCEIMPGIPLYMGKASKGITELYYNRISVHGKEPDMEKLKNVKTFEAAHPFRIGDIKITPFTVDHSAYDAHMFLIEAEGKKVLHTGDFRMHGFRGKGLIPTLKKYVGKVDALVCEGTTMSRADKEIKTEGELQKEFRQVMTENKYVFAVCSSTNFDRIAGICASVPRGRYCLCDKYQMSLLEYVRNAAGGLTNLYNFGKINTYGRNLDEKMHRLGFCMFVRSGNKEHRQLMEKYRELNPVVIYSMWSGYLKDEKVKDFLEGYRFVEIHTSGHGDREAIKTVIDTVQPGVVIPMHTEAPEAFMRFADMTKVVVPDDGERVKI